MDERLRTLERIASLALQVRTLERKLLNSKDPWLVMDRLKVARLDLDAELKELAAVDRGR